MKNGEVARIFSEVADMLEIKGENPFRVRAYRRAAREIEGLSKDVASLANKELLALPAIGADLAGKIEEILKTRRLEIHEALKKEIPGGFLDILSVPGLGPKTAKLLYEKLGVKNLQELEALAKTHGLSGLKGIKKKTEENILKGIGFLRRAEERRPIGRVLPVAEGILARLKSTAPVREISLAGSIRRRKETIKDIDIIATSEDSAKVMREFVKMPDVKEVLMKGPTKSTVLLEEGLQVDLRVVETGSFGAAIAYFTGSKEHNIRIREMAVKKGLKINEYGVFDEKGKRLAGEKEQEIYSILGLEFIPPELREERGEIEAALQGRLPKLIELKDIKGDLHIHSLRSDGMQSPAELARAAKQRGYKYIAITDHSKGLGIAGGLSEKAVLDEIAEIDALNKKLKGFRILKGIEVDIRSNGTLDFPDEILTKFDIVVAAIHSGFRQSKEKMTGRILSAIKNPYVSVIAHPTGRLLGERDPYEVDMEEVLREAGRMRTAIEINAYPLRLDLGDINAREAKKLSVPIVISTDAHRSGQMDFMHYGVSIARRGWLEKGDVLNTMDVKGLMRALGAKRRH